jgi:ribosomal protein S8
MSLAIASILKEGFIEDFELCRKSKKIPINVIEIYKTRNPVICKIKRISKPGLQYIQTQNYREF